MGEYVESAKIDELQGKTVRLMTGSSSLDGKHITSITTIGRDGPTTADRKQALLLLEALQQGGKLLSNPWVQYILNGSEKIDWPSDFFPTDPPRTEGPVSQSTRQYNRPLNDSQIYAVEHMLARVKDKCVTVIQGPPGTGKTSVIAAFVEAALQSGQRGIWLIAQSNVAVKNIAEKLASSGFFDWRLLVSKDFHFEWCVPTDALLRSPPHAVSL
jgi:primosomal protein N'